jgi:hypothetical protein
VLAQTRLADLPLLDPAYLAVGDAEATGEIAVAHPVDRPQPRLHLDVVRGRHDHGLAPLPILG